MISKKAANTHTGHNRGIFGYFWVLDNTVLVWLQTWLQRNFVFVLICQGHGVALSGVGMLWNWLCAAGECQGLAVSAGPAPRNAKAWWGQVSAKLSTAAFLSLKRSIFAWLFKCGWKCQWDLCFSGKGRVKTTKHRMCRSTDPYLQFHNSSISLFIWWQNLTRNAVMLWLVFISPTEMFCCRNQLCLTTHASGGTDTPYLDLRGGQCLTLKTMSNICPLSIGLLFK